MWNSLTFPRRFAALGMLSVTHIIIIIIIIIIIKYICKALDRSATKAPILVLLSVVRVGMQQCMIQKHILLSSLSGRSHLRSSEDNKLFVPRSLTASMGPRTFCSSGPTSWNTLPARLRSHHWHSNSSSACSRHHCLWDWQLSVICAFWSVCLLLLLLYLIFNTE